MFEEGRPGTQRGSGIGLTRVSLGSPLAVPPTRSTRLSLRLFAGTVTPPRGGLAGSSPEDTATLQVLEPAKVALFGKRAFADIIKDLR